jgi:hypothetical protein
VNRERVRAGAGYTITVLAAALIWFALLAPNKIQELTPGAFLRIPIEGLVVVVAALLLPQRTGRVVVVIIGVLLGVLVIVKGLDMGYFDTLDRPFNPISDWSTFGPAIGVFRDSAGAGWANAAVVGAILLCLVLVVLVPLALVRLTSLTSRHRLATLRTVGVLTVVWLVCALTGLQFGGSPFASRSDATLAYAQVSEINTALHDKQTFGAELSANDPYANLPADQLLSGLRGKDVIVAVVESYGQNAVQNSWFAAQDDRALVADTAKLQAAGFQSRSGFLRSSTFGGISWLAHSTFQSGLWVDSQQRYNQLVASNRFTLTGAFGKAGWRTVSDIPSDESYWKTGRTFYHYDDFYNATNVGYQGPKFSYAAMPDEYSLSVFQHRELGPSHAPVMAEIDLVSSHTPWAPLPHMVPWDEVGDGSIFDPQPAEGRTPDQVWQHASDVQANYAKSIRYSLASLVEFARTSNDPNLVLVVLGDHQPWGEVSGDSPTHNVPISIIAHDPAVLSRIDSWHWQSGLLPKPDAPLWPMNAFRNRFFSAYDSP